jgi:hypothetical protein
MIEAPSKQIRMQLVHDGQFLGIVRLVPWDGLPEGYREDILETEKARMKRELADELLKLFTVKETVTDYYYGREDDE